MSTELSVALAAMVLGLCALGLGIYLSIEVFRLKRASAPRSHYWLEPVPPTFDPSTPGSEGSLESSSIASPDWKGQIPMTSDSTKPFDSRISPGTTRQGISLAKRPSSQGPGRPANHRHPGSGAPPPGAPKELRHPHMAQALSELIEEVDRLSPLFADEATRSRFREEMGPGLSVRLHRLFHLGIEEEHNLHKLWIEPDLIPILNSLGRFLSFAIRDDKRGYPPARELAGRLEALLYDRLSPACEQEGWFAIDRVIPYETRFDHKRHHADGGVDEPDAAGLVVVVNQVGLAEARSGRLHSKAHVIVGR